MNRIPLIIDTDPGHDDVVALILAMSASNRLDLKAVTTVQGNQTVDKTTRNALRLKEFVGSTVPVAMGASHPLASPMIVATGHGATGLDGSTMPEPVGKPDKLTAVEMIAKVLSKSDEPVTICTLGPLMNIATFFLAYPHLIHKIKGISMMGGGFMRGNRSAAAELNLAVDPLSSAIVFGSGVPITLFALDITLKTGMLPEDIDFFGRQDDPLCKEIARILAFYQNTHRKLGRNMMPVHDACTVAWLLDPTLFSLRPARVDIDLRGRFTKGATIVDWHNQSGRPANCMFAYASDRPRMISMIQNAVKKVGESI